MLERLKPDSRTHSCIYPSDDANSVIPHVSLCPQTLPLVRLVAALPRFILYEHHRGPNTSQVLSSYTKAGLPLKNIPFYYYGALILLCFGHTGLLSCEEMAHTTTTTTKLDNTTQIYRRDSGFTMNCISIA